jgi:DNA-binding NarL/FixJ family response regulator
MAKITGLTVNALTGEEIEAELTPEELEFIETIKTEAESTREKELAAKEARQSALAKLAALGLTEEEIAAL